MNNSIPNRAITTRVISMLLTMSAMIFGVAKVYSQNTDSLKEIGRVFYVNFLPNVHDRLTSKFDSLQIFITTEKPTIVEVEAFKIGESSAKIEKYEIPANSTKLLKYQSEGYELPGDFVNRYKFGSQTPVKCGFRITSDEEIYVYALTSSRMSSDAMIIYPIESLGREYTVLSYTSDFFFYSQKTPGQFSIMATEDNTLVKIIPSSYTSKGDREPFTVMLNMNESLLVQGGEQKTSMIYLDSCDITGTQIIANKRIAVFGGHQRARVPYYTEASNPSRDFICEQLQAHETWGKNALIAPCPYVNTDSDYLEDVFRIVSSADKNRIRIGDEIIYLDKGKFYEGKAGKPQSILADEPIMIAQYKRSNRMYSNYGDRGLGDPLMILIPPVEQFIKEATFLSFDLNGDGSEERGFIDHYAVIVAPLEKVPECYIDNAKINPNKFQRIQNSHFAYATVKLDKGGVHRFKSDSKCGIYCYGYGYANSYGYAGGMRPQYLDVYKPQIESKEKECNNHKIIVDDNMYLSYGIKQIELLDNQSKNVQIDNIKINSDSNTAVVELSLIEKDRDGYYSIKAMDNGNNFAIYSDTIVGSALNFINLDSDGRIHLKVDNSFNRSCAKIMVQNKGLSVRVLNNISHTNSENYSFPPSQFPLSLAPGEIKELTICSQYKNKDINNNNIDTIKLDDVCVKENAIVQVQYEPFTTKVTSKCGVPLELTVSSIPEEIFIENTDDISSEGKVNITFGIEKDGVANVRLYDINGREIMEIYSGELKAGIYKSSIDCSAMFSGVYLINLYNNGKSESSKVIINN